METEAQVSPNDYFQLPHSEREPELVHGVVMERPMPDFLHSYIQLRMGHLLSNAIEKHPGYWACSELRMRVQEDVIRVLDLCLLNYKADPNSAPTKPPILAVEIVSKDDPYTEVLTKMLEYYNWGVPNIWLIDPRIGQLAYFGGSSLIQVNELTLPQFNLAVTLQDLLP